MRDLVKSFQIMGLSESEAIEAARGRDCLQADGDRLVEAFQDMGLGIVEARQAAHGRNITYGLSVDAGTDKSSYTPIKTVRRPLTERGDQRLRGGHNVDVRERVNMPVNLREKGRIVR